MDEIDNYNAEEAIAIGRDIRSIVCKWLQMPETSTDEELDRQFYKSTRCGGWFKFTETGVRIGTIVEGSDAEWVENIDYPFTVEDLRYAENDMEAWAESEWIEANVLNVE